MRKSSILTPDVPVGCRFPPYGVRRKPQGRAPARRVPPVSEERNTDNSSVAAAI
jgi:hypothetical protein